MVITGLESIISDFPDILKGKRIGILCHAPSITSDFEHISDIFFRRTDCKLSALFGPQHGLYGQTQDNMIEWQSMMHPFFRIPLFSLYGEHRKPTDEMLNELDVLVIDLQDVGARLYTYIWTVKLCMEACAEKGITVVVLDRPNPIGKVQADGPVLKEEFFTFVGGASIPLCHRMTLGEMAMWIKAKHINNCDLHVIWMINWRRSSLYSETGLPWVLPSPNMPTEKTAIVYPGTVLIEALNLSEGRGTTIPFELFGAPFIDSVALKKNLDSRKIEGCAFRVHGFIPAFHKFTGQYCNGLQIHVTNINKYKPVCTALEIFNAIIETSPGLSFNNPPYEYENNLMPFDILSGDSGMRETLAGRKSLKAEKERWENEISEFHKEFSEIAAYNE
ncbi:MAG TPA: DUF1343 domain-containing protein [Bacteroidales bacterium]|nr:DUF1343 domain-containing protein [Bacteroidales bacterium]